VHATFINGELDKDAARKPSLESGKLYQPGGG
jgi:hypothetical protein